MKNWNTIKLIVVTLIAIGLSFLGFITPKINSQLISGILTLIPILTALFQYYYDNQNDFFILVQKTLQWFSNPKIDWKQELDFTFMDENLNNTFFNDYTNELVEELKKKGLNAKRIDDPKSSQNEILINNPGEQSLKLSFAETSEEDTYQIYVQYSASFSYRNRLKGVDQLQQIYLLATAAPNNVDSTKTRLRINLFFEKGNPFYGYLLRTNGATDVSNFNLQFIINSKVNAKVQKGYIQLNSDDFKACSDALRQLVVLQNIN